MPAWWECELPRPKLPGPLFLHPVELGKGQVWLNGRAVGRYWDIGPQKTLYLPEPWWHEHNRLAILDEDGRSPDQSFIARDRRVPTYKSSI
jgi:beta-galactosidase